LKGVGIVGGLGTDFPAAGGWGQSPLSVFQRGLGAGGRERGGGGGAPPPPWSSLKFISPNRNAPVGNSDIYDHTTMQSSMSVVPIAAI